MEPKRIQELIAFYRQGLLEDVMPFWLHHGVDPEYGGVMTCLDRDGSVLDTDKGMWQQGRFIWLLSTLCTEVEPRDEWLDVATRAVDFVRQHGFDDDGRMWFHVTRDGRPLRKRRYVFTECFGAMAFAAYAHASGDDQAATEARELLHRVLDLTRTPESLPPKMVPGTRPTKSLGLPMILLNVAQVFEKTIGDPVCDDLIAASLAEIRHDFVKPELEVVMETVGTDGGVVDHLDGRLLNPGHAIEASWFVLEEARRRNGDKELLQLGLSMLAWAWKRGWDTESGGLFAFRDLHDKPVQEPHHDMKLWWPHCEAIIATLHAHLLTGSEDWELKHRWMHDWTHHHFPDEAKGEWYGYLNRAGRVANPSKGNLFKGPFHIPRMQLLCWKLLETV